eukprot:4401212-Prymnesium_polylepis.1
MPWDWGFELDAEHALHWAAPSARGARVGRARDGRAGGRGVQSISSARGSGARRLQREVSRRTRGCTRAPLARSARRSPCAPHSAQAVSYTHLTLPTICSV